jgi:predicted nucleic acid-binding protein
MPETDSFLDTNILLYSVSTAPEEAEKTRLARALMQAANWAWSAQVAAEFVRASTSTRQTKPLTRTEARRWIETWMAFPMVAIDGALVLEALQISEHYQTSHFDAQILAAAKRLGCTTLYSEDLNHGQDYGGVRVLNPFRPV